MRIDNPEFAALNQGRSKRPFFVVEIEFAPGDLVYITSHEQALTPGGQVLPGLIKAIGGTTQRIDPAKGNATIGSIHFEVVDKNGAFTDLLRSKLTDDKGLRHKRVRFYKGFEGLESFADYVRFQTQRVESAEHDGGSYRVRCYDVQRSMREELFEPQRTALSAAISAAATEIPVYQPGAFEMVAHGSSYSDAPNATVGYLKIGSGNEVEIVRYTGKTDRTFIVDRRSSTLASATTTNATTVTLADASAFRELGTGTMGGEPFSWAKKEGNTLLECSGVTAQPAGAEVIDAVGRGVMGTRARDWEMKGDKEDNGTSVEEYIYLELPAVKLIYALLTGHLYNQPGQQLPAHWHLGIPAEYVHLPDFVSIGGDWWNPSDDSQGQVVRFEGLTKEDGKRFIEEQLCLLLGAFMPVYSDGALGLKRMTGVLSDAGYVDRLDETNIVRYGALQHDMRGLQNRFLIEWNWRPHQEEFTRKNLLIDGGSIRRHGESDLTRLSFKGLHGSRHSYSTLKNQFDSLRDRYAGPPQRLSLRLLPSKNTLEVGDVVWVNLTQLRDYNGTAELDRAFEVQQVRVDWVSGQVDVELFGSSEKAEPLPSEESSAVVAPDYYRAGTALASLPGATLAGGVLRLPSANLVGGVYYHVGDVTLPVGATLTVNANVELRVAGFLTINGKIDGRGRGLPGGMPLSAAAYGSQNTEANFRFARTGEPAGGTPGFIGSTKAYGGWSWARHGNLTSSGPNDTPEVSGRNAAFPGSISPEFRDGALIGVPPDLRGTSGGAGNNIVRWDRGTVTLQAQGGAGGAGGAGLVILCRGMDFGVGGQIDLSGADGAIGQSWAGSWPGWSATFFAGTGAGGAPGALLVLLDGAATVPTISDRTFRADMGGSPLIGERGNARLKPNPAYSWYIGKPEIGEAMWQSAHLVRYVKGAIAPAPDLPDTADAPLGVTLIEHPNTPRTPGGNLSTISVYAQPPNDAQYAYANAYYRLAGTSAWTPVAVPASPETLITVASDGSAYEVQLRAVSKTGVESPSGPLASITVTNIDKPTPESPPVAEILPVPDVRGLELYGQANDTDFAGRDAKFVWRESSITEWQALGWDAAKSGARDLYFRDYQVTVYDVETGQVRRVAHTVDPEYTYTYEQNVEDSTRLGIAGPRRQFRVEVVARGRQSQVSRMPARLTVQNPAPELPAGWHLVPGYFEASAAFLIPDDTDFRRINVYASTQQGFAPSASNRVWQGSDSPARIADLAQDTAYYYRYEAEDAFGPGAMSGELSFTTKQLSMPDVSGVQEAISGVEDWLREHDDEFEVLENDITSAQQAIANETEARTVQYNALDARVTDNETGLASKASITYVDDAVAGEASARATAISQVSADLGDLGATVTQVSTAVADIETGLAAEYTLTVDAGGNVTGIKLRSDASGGAMTFLGDAFAFATQGGKRFPFTIDGNDIVFDGRVSFGNVDGRPTSLSDLDSAAATKLAGIATGADKTQTVIDGGLVTTGTLQLQDGGNTTKAGITAAGTGDGAVRLWAGETFANRASAPFRVTQDGKLVATGATISGSISSGGLVIAANGNLRSGKSSYSDPSTGWWIGSEEGLHKLAITNQNETKGLRFDGDDLIILRDTQLRGADAYNNNSIYIHERLPMPTHVLKQVKTGGGALIETSEGDWRVAVHNGPGRIIARYTLLEQNGIRYFTLWDPFRLKTKWNPGILFALRQGDYVRIGMGSDPDGFEFNHVAVYLETRNVASGALRTRGVVKTDAGTYYTDELVGSTLPGTLEIVWTPITETSALVEFRLFNWTRSVTVPYLHGSGLPFVPYFVEAMSTGSGGVGVNIAVTEFIFLQEG